jgi:hypothetical protein
MAPGTDYAEERQMRDAKIGVGFSMRLGVGNNQIESSDLGQTRVNAFSSGAERIGWNYLQVGKGNFFFFFWYYEGVFLMG